MLYAYVLPSYIIVYAQYHAISQYITLCPVYSVLSYAVLVLSVTCTA